MSLDHPETPIHDLAIEIPDRQGVPDSSVTVEIAGVLERGVDNLILVSHDFHHDHHAAAGWWSEMIGPGRPLDTDRYTVITPSHTPEGSSPSATTEPDELRVAHLADRMAAILDSLGIQRLHAVVGGGSGGLVALTFAVRHPDRTRRLISISSGARVTTLQSMHLAHQIAAIDLAGADRDRLELAWRIFTVRRGSLTALETAAGSSTIDDIDRHLEQASRRYWQWASPRSLRLLLQAWRRFDLAVDTGSPDPDTALSRLRDMEVLVLGIDSDTLFYPAEQAYLTARLEAAGVHTRRYTFHSEQGHDGWIIDPLIYGPLVTEALST